MRVLVRCLCIHSPLTAVRRVLCRSCLQVRHAFIEYSEYMKVEVDRVRANIQKLQPHQKAALPEAFWRLHERCVAGCIGRRWRIWHKVPRSASNAKRPTNNYVVHNNSYKVVRVFVGTTEHRLIAPYPLSTLYIGCSLNSRLARAVQAVNGLIGRR